MFESGLKLGASDLDSVQLLAQKLHSEALTSGDRLLLFQSGILSSLVYINKLKLDTAQQLLDKSKMVAAMEPCRLTSRDFGLLHLHQTGIFIRRGMYDKALQEGYAALDFLKVSGDTAQLISAYATVGVVQNGVHKFPEALDAMLKAYELMESQPAGASASRLTILTDLSYIYKSMGQAERGLKYARQSLRVAEQLRDEKMLFGPLNALGHAHTSVGNYDSAIHYYDRSYALAQKTASLPMQLFALGEISRIFSLKGEYRKACDIQLSRIRDFPRHAMFSRDAYYLIGANLLELGQYDSAIHFTKRALTQAQRPKYPLRIADASFTLYRSYAQLNQPDSAMKYLAMHYATKDSLYSLENQKKFSSLYAQLENLTQQREIDLLTKDKKLADERNASLQASMIFGTLVALSILAVVSLVFVNRNNRAKLHQLRLERELERKSKELNDQALRMITINNSVLDLEENLRRLKMDSRGDSRDVQKVLNAIKINKAMEREWDNFDKYFGNVHTEFYDKLETLASGFTVNEKRMASLLKMNLTNAEIASIMNIEVNSVKMAKYRLKKKLNLADEQDIHEYFRRL